MYTDDLAPLDGCVWITYVRSTQPHARILSIDTSDALALDGVVAVFTAADIDLGPVPPDMAILPTQFVRTFLASDVVRYVGEPVAVVVTQTRAQGEDAIESVIVDYEPLPAVVDVADSLRGEVLLHPATGTNVAARIDAEVLDVSDCEIVVRQRVLNSKVATCPMEPLSGMAQWPEGGRIELWTTSQGPHIVRNALVAAYGLAPEAVRVVSPDVGGAFGGKAFPYPEQLLLPWIARRVARPVRWAETRSESMLTIGHGRGQVQDIVIGGTRDGHVCAYDLTVLQDIGAYARVSTMLPALTRLMHPGPYAIDRTAYRSEAVFTNTVPMMAFRGAGRPEATAAIERAMDLFAAEIGMDPAEVRRRNVITPDAFPFTTTAGTTYDSGEYAKALDLALAAAGYDELRSEQARRRASGDIVQMGIGLAVYVEITAGSGGTEFARVEVLSGGKVRVRTGSFSHGQGHATMWAMLVSDRTGIAMEDIEVIDNDTDLVPRGGLTGGSRSMQIAGSNVARAAEIVVERAREQAAHLLEAHVEDVVIDSERGVFHVVGSPTLTVSWTDVAAASDPEDLTADGDIVTPGGSFPSGAHIAVVDVDTETGRVVLTRLVAADDAGRILNPLLAEGQVHGGLASGIAQALLEQVVYDEEGTPLTTNFADYGIISAAELPSFETIHVETPSPRNPLGAKGIGESGSVGATPAVQNAVVDALSHLGISHIDMPLTASRVWAAIDGATTAGSR